MNRALLVVDVQNDFCERGSLAVAGGAAVAARISEVVESNPDRWRMIVTTQDWHESPGAHFATDAPPDFHDTWPVHCVAGTTGAELHPELRLPTGVLALRKGEHQAAYSGFEGHDAHGRSLDTLLHAADIDELEVAGLATSYCVRATALDGRSLGYATTLLLDLCADVDPEATPATLAKLEAAGVAVSAFAPD